MLAHVNYFDENRVMFITQQTELQYMRFNSIRDEIHGDLVRVGVGDALEHHGVLLESEPFEPVVPRYIQEYLDSNPGIEIPHTIQYKIDKEKRKYEGLRRVSRYIVSRRFIFDSEAATTFRDMDPLARCIALEYEVGVATEVYPIDSEVPTVRTIKVALASDALIGGEQEPAGIGDELNLSQVAVIEGAIMKLVQAKQSGELSLLTPSLTKIEFAGD